MVLVAISIFKFHKRKFNFSVLVSYLALFYLSSYCGNLAKYPSLKLFFIVLSLILFLNHSIWTFVGQDMGILLSLAGLVLPRIYGQFIDSGSFGQLTLGSNFTWLWAEFGLVFFIKVVVLCHTFPMPQKSGHLDLSSPSYGQMNKHCSFGHFCTMAVHNIQI